MACSAPLAADTDHGRHRKIVTALFVDLIGSTEIVRRLDPERFHDFLETYFGRMRTILKHHGASVEKFVGECSRTTSGTGR